MIRAFRLAPALVSLGLAAALPARADDAPTPMVGDKAGGARMYTLDCESCHGKSGDGDGPLAAHLDPKPSRLRDGGYLFSHSDEEIVSAILGQTGDQHGMTMHGRGLSPLDARDILAWVKEPVPTLGQIFPGSSQYIAHVQVPDQFGLDRAEKALGAPLPENERSLMVFTMFKPADPAEGEKPAATGNPQKVADNPSALYELKPRRKLGFVAYLPLAVEGGTVDAVLALDRKMTLVDVRTIPSADEKTEALRKKVTPILESFVGSGGRDEKKPIEPQKKGVKAPKDVQAAMLKAYTRVLEGAAMYEKEERDRFWADPDAFKFPEAEQQPDNVKFEFKQKGPGKK